MNILITGGAGFVATHIAIRLNTKENNIILVDFEDQYTKFHKENFKTYNIDISKSNQLNTIEEDIDVIYHCAALSGVKVCNDYPNQCVDSNIKGTFNICKFAQDKQCSKLIYTSTMAVYGEGDNLKETQDLNPISSYGISKLAGEYFVKTLSSSKINYTIFRLFNTYGPGQDIEDLTQGLVSIFLSQAISGKHIKVTGSLDRHRDLIYVSDVVDAMELALETDCLSNQVFNVCNEKKITIYNLINTILDAHDDQNSLFFVENIGGHPGDQHGTVGSNSLLMSKGWSPKITLKKGIELFYNHSKKIKSRNEAWQRLVN